MPVKIVFPREDGSGCTAIYVCTDVCLCGKVALQFTPVYRTFVTLKIGFERECFRGARVTCKPPDVLTVDVLAVNNQFMSISKVRGETNFKMPAVGNSRPQCEHVNTGLSGGFRLVTGALVRT